MSMESLQSFSTVFSFSLEDWQSVIEAKRAGEGVHLGAVHMLQKEPSLQGHARSSVHIMLVIPVYPRGAGAADALAQRGARLLSAGRVLRRRLPGGGTTAAAA